jgi:hypothetical protein
MATTITKKPAAAVDKGGNYIINVVLAATTAAPGYALPTINDTTAFDLGHIAQSNVGQASTKSSFKNENGDTVNSSFDYELVTTGQLMQTDADLINYIGQTVKGATILQIKHTGTVNGLDQWHFQVGQVTPQYNISRPGGTTANNYEHTGFALTTDFVIPAATMLAIASTLAINTSSFFPTTTQIITSAKSWLLTEV